MTKFSSSENGYTYNSYLPCCTLSNFQASHYLFFAKKALEHIRYGEVKIIIKDRNSQRVIQTIIRNGNNDGVKISLKKNECITVEVSGCHTFDLINLGKVQFKNEEKSLIVLPNGDKIYKGKILFICPELDNSGNGSKVKKGETTFWPEFWSFEKIVQKIVEAYLCSTIKRNNDKWISKTKDGIEIEGYSDKKTGLIKTAYIVMNKYDSFK